MATELFIESATRMAELVRSRQVSPLELVDAHLARIEALHSRLNAFVLVRAEQARAEARAAEAAIMRGEARGALHGVPVSIKDSIEIAGLPTTCGSKLRQGLVSERDAAVVERLRAAGAIVLGKTNVPECVMDWRTTNPVFGRTANPWNRDFVPGGSSGGEAAAVASGCSAGGLGSDLGGSVRVPAHFCGLFGLRPTPGCVPASGFAVPSTGPISLAHSFGPIARSADDLQLFFSVLAGFDPCDPVSFAAQAPEPHPLDPRQLRAAMCVDGGIPIATETRQAVERAAQALATCGADVATWVLPAIAEAPQIFFDWVMQASIPAIVGLYRGREDAMGPLVKGLSKMAQPTMVPRFLEAWSSRDALRRSILDRMRDRAVLIMPVCSTHAFRHDQRGALSVGGTSVDYATSFGYAELASLAALPAVVVPVARSADGLPIGVQLVGRPLDEPLLLATAQLLEREIGGYQRPTLRGQV